MQTVGNLCPDSIIEYPLTAVAEVQTPSLSSVTVFQDAERDVGGMRPQGLVGHH